MHTVPVPLAITLWQVRYSRNVIQYSFIYIAWNMIFRNSKVAHKWIDPIEAKGGRGIEFGPASHNPFGFRNCIYADREQPQEGSPYYQAQMELAGSVARIDTIADLGTPLPFEAGKFDYIVTSHVLEHVWDLIGCFKEMKRVLKPNGVMVHVIPHVERTFDKGRPLTTWEDLVQRHSHPEQNPCKDDHHSVFTTEAFVLALTHIPFIKVLETLDIDDKVGNGFLVILQIEDGFFTKLGRWLAGR